MISAVDIIKTFHIQIITLKVNKIINKSKNYLYLYLFTSQIFN